MLDSVIHLFTRTSTAPHTKTLSYPATDQLQNRSKNSFFVTIRKEKISSFSRKKPQVSSRESAKPLRLKHTTSRDRHREARLALKTQRGYFELPLGIMCFIFLFLRHSWKGEGKKKAFDT